MVMVYKGRCNFRDIILMDVQWKFIPIIINGWLQQCITVYDYICVFQADRGLVTTKIESNMNQNPVFLQQASSRIFLCA